MKRLILPAAIIATGTISMIAIMATKAEPIANPDKLAEPPKPKVTVQKVLKQTARLSAKSQGSVKAKREIDIVAQVSGQVIQVTPSFVNGGFVKQGEVLIKIDDRDHQASLINAKSRLAQAERELAEEKGRSRQANQEWRDLGNQEANDLFLRKPQLTEARLEVEAAKSNLAIATLNIERTNIRLPFNGRIQQTLVNLGQFIGIGTPIANVYDTSTVEVRLSLSDRQMALLDLPVSNSQFSQPTEVTLTGEVAGKVHQWQGQITRTEASADVRTRLYYAIAEVEQPFSDIHSAPLLPGLFVKAEISGKELNDVVVLPKDVLVNRTNLYSLNTNNQIQLSVVTVLQKNNNKVWLQTDLSPNTRVLLEKHAVLTPGMTITPLLQQRTKMSDDADIAIAKQVGNTL